MGLLHQFLLNNLLCNLPAGVVLLLLSPCYALTNTTDPWQEAAEEIVENLPILDLFSLIPLTFGAFTRHKGRSLVESNTDVPRSSPAAASKKTSLHENSIFDELSAEEYTSAIKFLVLTLHTIHTQHVVSKLAQYSLPFACSAQSALPAVVS